AAVRDRARCLGHPRQQHQRRRRGHGTAAAGSGGQPLTVRPGTGPALPAREHSPAAGGTVADTKRVEELYDLIEGIEIAMFTTRRPDGRLVSRPMATQERRPDADLWFVTDVET